MTNYYLAAESAIGSEKIFFSGQFTTLFDRSLTTIGCAHTLAPQHSTGGIFMSDQPILTHVENKVATLTFNRPDKLNALSRELLTQSAECLKRWSHDPEVGAIVVTGSGRAFCAGGDVSNMAKDTASPQNIKTLEEQIDGLREAQELSWLLYNMPKPTIAAVNGHAMGAGLGVCLACD